ncbi:MAG: Trm112 family protein [Propionibacteriaceae bacterium]|nr:Trm112 family protein [Propionibacteriaceae bacterium]
MIDLDPAVLDLLACPNCHAAFAVDPDRAELVCTGTGCGLAFPVKDNIPILLIDEARPARSNGTGHVHG